MKKIKIIAGITWAFFGLLFIIILFPGLNNLSAATAKLPFMKLHPRYTGGEVAKQIVADNCTLNIRKPVFNGLVRERKTGFVQLDWHGKIPDNILDTIDYDLDGVPDFYIRVDRKVSNTEFNSVNNKVKKVTVSTPTSYGWAVRVELVK